MSAGPLLPRVPQHLLDERNVQQLLSLLGYDLRKRQSPFFLVHFPDFSSRGRGLDTWLQAKVTSAGVSRMDYSLILAAALSQSWRSRFATPTRHGRSSLAFTLRLFNRFFQHICGRSPYANLRECLTALWHARQSRRCMIRSVKFVQASLGW